MARGGRRSGAPGRAYSNRTDLNVNRSLPVEVASGQRRFGAAAEQERAQRVVPLAAPRAWVAPPSFQAPATSPVALDAPSARPGEPLTHGAPIGPGAGPEVLAAHGLDTSDPSDVLRALYARFPSEDLRELLEDVDEGAGF